jgi:hypothetical protein
VKYCNYDNGNIVIVQKNMTQKAAEKMVKGYTAKGHKQWYWSEKQKKASN